MKLAAALVSALALAACAHAPAKPAASMASASMASGSMAADDDSCEMDTHIDPTGAKVAFDHPPKVGEKAKCPVSGDAFFVTAHTRTTEYQGKWYAFCCGDCPHDFAKDPAKYAK